MRRRLACALLGAVLLGVAPPAAGADDETRVDRARAEYAAATDDVKQAKWAEALAAFERSAALRPHATTTFDIAACERVLGRYTRALVTLRRALAENTARPGELAESFVSDAEAMSGEIERLLAHVQVTIAPRDAAIAVDGRALRAASPRVGSPLLVAGIEPPGMGAAPPADAFEVLVNPGPHVFTLTHAGYATAVLRRTFTPGAHEALALTLDRLPATLHVESSVADAVVTVEGLDVGAAPVDVSRAPGSYSVRVRKRDYEPYEAQIVLRPGEIANIRATLVPQKHALTEAWWFWTGVGVVVVGAAVVTYAATRPESPTPAYSAGSLGWVATGSALRW